jgi:hypothetical protein
MNGIHYLGVQVENWQMHCWLCSVGQQQASLIGDTPQIP